MYERQCVNIRLQLKFFFVRVKRLVVLVRLKKFFEHIFFLIVRKDILKLELIVIIYAFLRQPFFVHIQIAKWRKRNLRKNTDILCEKLTYNSIRYDLFLFPLDLSPFDPSDRCIKVLLFVQEVSENYFFTELSVSHLTEMLLQGNIEDRDHVDDIGANDPVVKVWLAIMTAVQSFRRHDQNYDIHWEKHQEGVHSC